ncbi:MAG: hypothetical protein HS115_04220 [Spirochaetales bacterium]|nr:hypothetical protein [Spirochaetales bacterium]
MSAFFSFFMKFTYQRFLLRFALFWLCTGLLAGGLLYFAPLFDLTLPGGTRTTHVHLLTVGFLLQLIMGVALWMFPRYKKEPRYNSNTQGFALIAMINMGVLLRSAGSLWLQLSMMAHVGVALELLGVLYFVFLIFGRIREP